MQIVESMNLRFCFDALFNRSVMVGFQAINIYQYLFDGEVAISNLDISHQFSKNTFNSSARRAFALDLFEVVGGHVAYPVSLSLCQGMLKDFGDFDKSLMSGHPIVRRNVVAMKIWTRHLFKLLVSLVLQQGLDAVCYLNQLLFLEIQKRLE
jgi:hypothetical protein